MLTLGAMLRKLLQAGDVGAVDTSPVVIRFGATEYTALNVRQRDGQVVIIASRFPVPRS